QSGHDRLRTVPERRARHRDVMPSPRELAPGGLPGEMSQADDRPQARSHLRELGRQPRFAGVALQYRGLVLRRRAPPRGRHSHAKQALHVACRDASRLRGQPAPPERCEQDVAAAIAGEDAAGSVPTVRRGRKSDDQHAWLIVAPARHRAAPIRFGREGPSPGCGYLFAPGNQARAGAADRLPGRQFAQRVRPGRESADAVRSGRDRRGGRRRIVGPARSWPDRTSADVRRLAHGAAVLAAAPVASDHAIPSRMSCSLATISANPNLVMTRSRINAPAPITSTRPGWITSMAARWAWFLPSSSTVTSCTRPAL